MDKNRKMLIVLPGITDAQREKLQAAADKHRFEVFFTESVQEALPYIAQAEVILGGASELAENAPALRWLCTTSAGVNQFVKAEVFQNQAILSNSSGAYGVTIAEHTVMLILEVLRRESEYCGIVSRREWKRDLSVRSIHSSRVLLLGTGNLAQEISIRLRAFAPDEIVGINRLGQNPGNLFDRVITQDKLEEALPGAELVIVTLPGTPHTYHMLNERRLSLLPDGALIVNVGRGSVIEEAALEKELRSGRLQAALDVFEQEPLHEDSPLWDCPNLLITPHVAGNLTLPYTRERVVSLFLSDFENYCSSLPLRRAVDLSEGY